MTLQAALRWQDKSPFTANLKVIGKWKWNYLLLLLFLTFGKSQGQIQLLKSLRTTSAVTYCVMSKSHLKYISVSKNVIIMCILHYYFF